MREASPCGIEHIAPQGDFYVGLLFGCLYNMKFYKCILILYVSVFY